MHRPCRVRDKTVRYALSKNDRALVAGFDGGSDAFAAGYVFTLEPPRGQTAKVPPLGLGVVSRPAATAAPVNRTASSDVVASRSDTST